MSVRPLSMVLDGPHPHAAHPSRDAQIPLRLGWLHRRSLSIPATAQPPAHHSAPHAPRSTDRRAAPVQRGDPASERVVVREHGLCGDRDEVMASGTVTRALVSIIVLNFNAEKIIGKCLDHLLAQSYPNFA